MPPATERPDPLAEPEGLGRRVPAQLQGPVMAAAPEGCCSFGWSVQKRLVPGCQEALICSWRVGCVGEHNKVITFCREHLFAVARAAANGSRFFCELCDKAHRGEGDHIIEAVRWADGQEHILEIEFLIGRYNDRVRKQLTAR